MGLRKEIGGGGKGGEDCYKYAQEHTPSFFRSHTQVPPPSSSLPSPSPVFL